MINRSTYEFIVYTELSNIINVINEYLSTNNFNQVSENGEIYYLANSNDLTAPRCFSLKAEGNKIIISAWLKTASGEINLESNTLSATDNVINEYKASIQNLFNKMNAVNTNTQINNTPINNNEQPTIDEQTMKNMEKSATTALILSIVGLLLILVGFVYGVFVYIFIVISAIQGLKTRKRKTAIASLVITGLSFILLLILMFT